MAATEIKSSIITELTNIDADWDFGRARQIKSIQFIPGATNDVLVVKNGSAIGATMAELRAEVEDVYVHSANLLIKDFGKEPLWPYIDVSVCTLNAGHKVIIEFR